MAIERPAGPVAAEPAWDVVPPALASGRVLIIDDNKAILAVLTRLLQHAGLSAIQAVSDAAEAVAAYQDFRPDLVLLDLHMPGLSGFEVLEQLQARSQEVVKVPVVMLTGDQDQRNRTRALAMGASDFLNKPFDSMEVLLRVRARLETRSLELRLAEHNQELEARVASRTRELEASQLEMLQRLAIAAELRDDETGQHTQRVGAMAGRLALAAGLPPERADLIARAAPLHDEIILAIGILIGNPAVEHLMPIAISMNRAAFFRAKPFQVFIVNIEYFSHDTPLADWIKDSTLAASLCPG